MSWPTTELGDLVEIRGGGTPSKAIPEYWNGDIPWASVKDLKTTELKETEDCVTADAIKKSASNLIPAGNIIVPTRMALGKVAINTVDMAINQDLKALIPIDQKKLDKSYLMRFLESQASFLEKQGKGATVKGITLDVLRSLAVPLPPLEEQKRIAAILDKADAIRRKRQQAIKLADDFLRSVFLEMFGDPVTNPKGWDKCCIGDICEVQGGLQVSTKRKGLPLLKPYLRVANVLRNKIDLGEIKFMNVTEAEASRIALKENDILVVEGHGNKAEIGRCAIWTGDLEGVIHQNHLIRVRVKSNLATTQVVNDFINSSGGRSQMLRSSNTTSGLNTISTGIVKSTEMYLPPIDVQIRYGKICKKVSGLLSKVLSSKDASNENFLSLSKKAFSGTL